MQKWNRRNAADSNWKPKNKPVLVQSVFGSKCKRFCDTAIRENFNLKPETQMEKTHSNNWDKYVHYYNGVKKETAVSFLRLYLNNIWAPCQRHVCISKSSNFSFLPRPETHFGHAQGHQRAGALTDSIEVIQNKILTEQEVGPQKTVNTKLWKLTNSFSEVFEELIHHNCRESQTGRRQKI